MPIPDFQSMMLPLLNFCTDRKEHSIREAFDHVATHFKLTDDELKELVPSGQRTIFENRVSWARTYMKKAKLILSPNRGIIQITERGINVIQEKPQKINRKYLMKFPEFVEFRSRKKTGSEIQNKQTDTDSEETPFESLENGYQSIREELAADILEKLKVLSPAHFEKLVVELIVKMGYGGTLKDAGKAVGRSGDGGIDGIIKEDRLGLDAIYIQAKRWEGNVSRPEIQKFTGALHMRHAKKGIFITTSNFSKEALECVKNIDMKIVLISGEQLAQYMIDYNLGVSTVSVYEIKKLDTDYFTDE